ncbi:hypothetical protein HYV56_00210 [Candidatus Peregrinibacteria bacterium]|nr:hypothetical protein [Candidatus Peregrinibacteria bacterium]
MAVFGAPTMITQSGPKTAILKSNHFVGADALYQKFFLLGKANLALWASNDRITKSQGMSNLLLTEKKARVNITENSFNKPKTQWQALQFARKIEGKIPKSQILVQLYDTARTHFKGTGG